MRTEVIIVDDCRISTFIIKNMVTRVGLSNTPLLFNYAREALAYLKRNKNPLTAYIILLDINMPGMNGWEFLKILNRDFNTSNIHVVVISSSTDREDHKMANEYNCVIDFIEKPVDINAGLRIKNNRKCAHHFFLSEAAKV